MSENGCCEHHLLRTLTCAKKMLANGNVQEFGNVGGSFF